MEKALYDCLFPLANNTFLTSVELSKCQNELERLSKVSGYSDALINIIKISSGVDDNIKQVFLVMICVFLF
jgi:hypothetical protein